MSDYKKKLAITTYIEHTKLEMRTNVWLYLTYAVVGISLVSGRGIYPLLDIIVNGKTKGLVSVDVWLLVVIGILFIIQFVITSKVDKIRNLLMEFSFLDNVSISTENKTTLKSKEQEIIVEKPVYMVVDNVMYIVDKETSQILEVILI